MGCRVLPGGQSLAGGHENLMMANEGLHDNEAAIEAGKNVVKLNPLDPAKAHYQLARLLHPTDPEEARTHVLASKKRHVTGRLKIYFCPFTNATNPPGRGRKPIQRRLHRKLNSLLGCPLCPLH